MRKRGSREKIHTRLEDERGNAGKEIRLVGDSCKRGFRNKRKEVGLKK